VSFTRQLELQSTEALMPHMNDERVRTGLARQENFSPLREVNMKTAGASPLGCASVEGAAYLNPR